jgi:hypothetical protein
LRETPAEKPLVVYNNAPNARALTLPLADTPLAGAQQLQAIFGDARATIADDEVVITLSPRNLAVFSVRCSMPASSR